MIIPCNLARLGIGVFWRINQTLFHINNLPRLYRVDGFSSLRIPEVSRDLNGTIFQCIAIDASTNPVTIHNGTITELIVNFGMLISIRITCAL